MPRSKTSLPVDECIRRLQEQVSLVSSLGFYWRRRPRTSPVVGRLKGDSFILESSVDLYSKRFVGTLAAQSGFTVIDWHWERGLGHRLFGDGQVDEEEILGFLREWIEVEDA